MKDRATRRRQYWISSSVSRREALRKLLGTVGAVYAEQEISGRRGHVEGMLPFRILRTTIACARGYAPQRAESSAQSVIHQAEDSLNIMLFSPRLFLLLEALHIHVFHPSLH